MKHTEDEELESRDSSAVGGDEETLLGAPLDKGILSRVFVFGGPLGLAIAICLSLWVSYWHVRHTLVVQVETQWEVGEQLAVRAHIVAERPGPTPDARGRIWVEQGEVHHPLGQLERAADTAIVQGTFAVPELSPGPAELHLAIEATGVEPMHEVLQVAIVQARANREPVPKVAGSTLQHGDDSDPQPEGMRIVVRPFGRILAGFDNTMMVRVTGPDGRPHEGPIEVVLAGGEYMGRRGSSDQPPVLASGRTDRMGLFFVEGPLTSDVLRIEVRVLSQDDPPQVLHRRRTRMVSYAGAVTVETSTLAVGPATGETLPPIELHAHGLSAKLPVFVDVRGPDGAFVEALPPFVGREPPREWRPPGVEHGIVQIEAYHFAKDPGESTAVSRLQVLAHERGDRATLTPLVELHRSQLHVPRVEKDFDRELERAHLDWLSETDLDAEAVETARRWLLGTLPIAVHGPPTVLVTHDRDVEALAAEQRRWTIGLRVFLLGGGGLFLLAMTWTMVRAHGRAALATQHELELQAEGDERHHAAEHVRRARRAALLRGLGLVAVMAGGLVLTTIMLESLLWVF